MNAPLTPTPAYLLKVAAATDVGRVRKSNQDAHVVAALGLPDALPTNVSGDALFDLSSHPVLLAVSDGMGGAPAGDVASAMVVDALRRSLPVDSEDWSKALSEAVGRANREVWSAAQAQSSRRGMGATLTALCAVGNHAYFAEVGDSRAYLHRAGVLTLLTHDQSLVQSLVDRGKLSPEEAEKSPMKNVILAAMGQREDVPVQTGRLNLQPNDTVLVCCDGLTNEVTAEGIADVLSTASAPSIACARLVAMANDHGGRDNITVIVGKVGVSEQ